MKAFTFCVLSICFIVSEAAVASKPVKKNPDYPDECYDPDMKIAISPDQPYHPKGECLEMSCTTTDANDEDLITTYSCGKVAVPTGVPLTSDMTKTYPDCCPRLK